MAQEFSQDNRKSKRFDVSFSAYFKNDSGRIDGSIIQMSEGGAIFVTGAHLAVRATGQLNIYAFQGEPAVEVSGEVIYTLRKGTEGDAVYRYGVRFSGVDKAAKEALAKIFMFVELRNRYSVRPKGNNTN